ncbi:MAG: polyphosphate kinase 2 family protein [Armatimonadota bacterium]|nr:polyphosphate kinase 2 family protein [Armatimonadota bacterium]
MAFARRVDGSERIRLHDVDPDDTAGLEHDEAERMTAELCAELCELQEYLYGASQHALLIVLQGRDTSGKDGTIRRVLGPLNQQGCSVASFKVPTAEELAHDFLWRVHARTPGLGQIAIFNRSHYEDVLVVRVHGLVPREVWHKRYEHINHFEKLLVDSGTIVLKFYLHISKKEQEERLRAREEDPLKSWKLSRTDWEERAYWDAYTQAYEDAINRCSAPHAPWFIVPADKKWFRNLAVAQTIVETLRPYRAAWERRLQETGEKARAEIAAYRQEAHG